MSKKILLSILDLAVVNDSDTASNALQRTKILAQHADKLGYERFWVAEHHNMAHIASSATAILIGFLAANTEKIRVGSGGIMLPNHAPLIIAEQFGTLQLLYNGRIDLGLGRAPGTDQLTAQAIRSDFFEQAQHFPRNVRELQRYFSASNSTAKVRAFPGEGVDVPIWILGSSTESAALAAASGLPYAFAGHFAPRQMYQAFEVYKSNFIPSVHLSSPKVMACVNAVAADTNEEAELLSSSLLQMFRNLVTNNRKGLQKPVANFVDQMSEEERFHVGQMTACSFVGDKASITKQLKEFIDYTGADEIMITSPIYDMDAKLHSMDIMKTVIDRINE